MRNATRSIFVLGLSMVWSGVVFGGTAQFKIHSPFSFSQNDKFVIVAGGKKATNNRYLNLSWVVPASGGAMKLAPANLLANGLNRGVVLTADENSTLASGDNTGKASTPDSNVYLTISLGTCYNQACAEEDRVSCPMFTATVHAYPTEISSTNSATFSYYFTKTGSTSSTGSYTVTGTSAGGSGDTVGATGRWATAYAKVDMTSQEIYSSAYANTGCTPYP